MYFNTRQRLQNYFRVVLLLSWNHTLRKPLSYANEQGFHTQPSEELGVGKGWWWEGAFNRLEAEKGRTRSLSLHCWASQAQDALHAPRELTFLGFAMPSKSRPPQKRKRKPEYSWRTKGAYVPQFLRQRTPNTPGTSLRCRWFLDAWRGTRQKQGMFFRIMFSNLIVGL